MHFVAMSPFYSADTNYARLVHVSDYLKPSPYNNYAGPRFAQYIRSVRSTIFRDLSPEQVLDMHYKLLGLQNEPTLDKLPTSGLSGESVGVETKRAIADVQGTIPIYRGIDIDIPPGLMKNERSPRTLRRQLSLR